MPTLSPAEAASKITQEIWENPQARDKVQRWIEKSTENAQAAYQHLWQQEWFGNTKLAHALKYVRMGLAIFPCHYVNSGTCSCGNKDCGSPGKHPKTKRGLHDATKDEERVRRWWAAHPADNIGVATGSASGAVVLDVDAERGGQESLEILCRNNGELPRTWECLTGGGGKHLWFKPPDHPVRNAVNLSRGIDVRGDGGYVLVPPSTHLSGRTYEWEASGHPEDIPLAEAPPWLFQARKENEAPLSQVQSILAGERNDTLFRLASAMRRRGSGYDAVLAALRAENEDRCQPPLEFREVATIAKSVMRYTPEEVPHSIPRQSEISVVSFGELLRQEFPPLRWFISGMLAEGLTLFSGRPKVGKSLMGLQLAIRIAQGGSMLHRSLEPHSVCLMALEDGARRVAQRSRTYGISTEMWDTLPIYLVSEFPDIASPDGKAALIALAGKYDIIIMDTLSRASPGSDWNDAFVAASIMDTLEGMHKDTGCSFFVIDHLRKPTQVKTDPFDEIAGSTMKTSRPTGLWVIRKEDEQMKLYSRLRDAEDTELVVFRDDKSLEWRTA